MKPKIQVLTIAFFLLILGSGIYIFHFLWEWASFEDTGHFVDTPVNIKSNSHKTINILVANEDQFFYYLNDDSVYQPIDYAGIANETSKFHPLTIIVRVTPEPLSETFSQNFSKFIKNLNSEGVYLEKILDYDNTFLKSLDSLKHVQQP